MIRKDFRFLYSELDLFPRFLPITKTHQLRIKNKMHREHINIIPFAKYINIYLSNNIGRHSPENQQSLKLSFIQVLR